MGTFSGAATWVTGSAAVLAAVVYLTAQARRMLRRVRNGLRAIAAIHDIVERELEHNHGSSMKDDVHGMAVAIGVLQREHDEDRRVVQMLLAIAARNHPDDPWLRRLTEPPREDT